MGAHANLYLMLDPGSYNFDPCHAEYFYVLHSSPIFILQHSSCKHVFSNRVENTVDPDQMAISQKPTDLDLQWFQRWINTISTGQGLIKNAI